MLSYEQSRQFVSDRLKFGIKPGLERIEQLMAMLRNPQDKLKFIHIAGTNGKGSTAAMLASILQAAGYKTGLYISPYISDFRERISVNGSMIPKQSFAEQIDHLLPLVNQMEEQSLVITEFELITAAAFSYFAKEQCDLVVLETGLGGRFDATNIIKSPLCSVITRIALDHTDILGDTYAKIAYEKAGIIKCGCDVVVAANQKEEVVSVLQSTAKEKGSAIHFCSADSVDIIFESIEGTEVAYSGKRIFLPLAGRYQAENLATVLSAVDVLRGKSVLIDDSAILEGVAAARFPARFEIMSRRPLVILDGTHNPNGAKALSDTLTRLLPDVKITAIMGMLRDKDVEKTLSILTPHFMKILAVSPDNPRAMSEEELCRLCSRFVPAERFEDKHTALSYAIGSCKEDEAVLICGSLYLAGELRGSIIDMVGEM
ncbi:MAG: bifunctional folylpolyglutamate synthase/dihydrofolate synthase [Oscillospiraceae bacterium]|jgi:dihydrofolate synthase/folylpolyglutamate synthase|nr:bifunctional folylpolyglutamate synthase/dihydrofolate synthase [Oscillospiraceae bacterium]